VADRARERFRAVSGEDDDDAFRLWEYPYVFLARAGDDRRERAVREAAAGMVEAGRDVGLLGPKGLTEAFPTVRADDVAVAAVARNAGHADTAAYAQAMADRARVAGADFRETAAAIQTDLPGVRVDGTTRPVDAVVVAAGAHTKRVLAEAGVPVATKPYRVQASTGDLEREDGDGDGDGRTSVGYDGPMVYDATAGVYYRPHPEETLLVGDGTEEREADPEDWDREANPDFRRTVTETVERRHADDVSLDRRRDWAGLCTATPDGDPLPGAVRKSVYVATGWHGHGFMRAPTTGELLAEAVLDGDPAPVETFDPRRFDGDETFAVVEGMLAEDR
jgi:glycine/D-amino acid oxidase-like deaminating enzyme